MRGREEHAIMRSDFRYLPMPSGSHRSGTITLAWSSMDRIGQVVHLLGCKLYAICRLL